MATKLPLHKLVMLGHNNTDCTALTIQFTLNHFVTTYDPTIEDSYRKQAVIDGKACILEVLDTAGQEEYTASRYQWIRDGEGFLVVYSITSRQSFHAATRYIDEIKRIKDSTDLPDLAYRLGKVNPPPIPIMLVGNRCDMVTEREVATQEGAARAIELGIGFIETSAKNCINVEKAFYEVVRELRKHEAASIIRTAPIAASPKSSAKKSSRQVSTMAKIFRHIPRRTRQEIINISPPMNISPPLGLSTTYTLPTVQRPITAKKPNDSSIKSPTVHGSRPGSSSSHQIQETTTLRSTVVSDMRPAHDRSRQVTPEALPKITTSGEESHGTGRVTPNFSKRLPPRPPPRNQLATEQRGKETPAMSPPMSMYVRALFDYDADDPTSLSIREGDIIQVITQLESGWWDGVMNGVRGWFPSNYCTIVPHSTDDWKDEENGGLDNPEPTSLSESDYSDSESESTKIPASIRGTESKEQNESNLFWIPQATPDGRLFYFNTLTGASTMEPPLESPSESPSRLPIKVTSSLEKEEVTSWIPIAPVPAQALPIAAQVASSRPDVNADSAALVNVLNPANLPQPAASPIKGPENTEKEVTASSISHPTSDSSTPPGSSTAEPPLDARTEITRDAPEPKASRTIQHKDYESPRDVPYKHIDVLGHGHCGFVEEIEAVSNQPGIPPGTRFARKTILVPRARSAETTRVIRNEINIMKRLDHEHVIKIAATYTVGNKFAILMQPVATMNLAEYMEKHPSPSIKASPMRSWFGCLASCLAYLHSQRIKHRDIKPANILVKGRDVILTDFGIAHDVQDEITSSTVGTVDSKTPMYCAPEVADAHKRGRAADIFSLGCVFLEMTTVLMWKYGSSLAAFHEFKKTPEGRKAYHLNAGKTLQWILRLFNQANYWGKQSDFVQRDPRCAMLVVCYAMLQPRPQDRLSAFELTSFLDADRWIGTCCKRSTPLPITAGDLFNKTPTGTVSASTEFDDLPSEWEQSNANLGYEILVTSKQRT